VSRAIKGRLTAACFLIAVLAMGLVSTFHSAPTAHAAAGMLRYQRGYTVQGSWLCYGWANGAYHCTQHWYRAANGEFVSLNAGWVPSQQAGANGRSKTDADGDTDNDTCDNCSGGGHGAPPAPSGGLPLRTAIGQWNYTGYGAFTAWWGAAKGYAWGNCTAGAAALSGYIPSGLGNAENWAWNARARGMAVGYSPSVGATAVFQPGVQGAGGEGHVARVVGVYGNGWFMVEEENFWWNGGGFNRVSYRYAHTGWGVQFIY